MTTPARPPIWRRRLLFGVMIWLVMAGGALWLHRRPPVADVILSPVPGWQFQVWFGTQTTITHRPGQPENATLPIVVVFYRTPYTGIRLLARFALPAWPLGTSIVLLTILALLLMRGPALTRTRA
jgi:hypothetical protein